MVGPLRSVKYGFVLATASFVTLVLAPLAYRSRLAGLSALLLIPVALVLALVALVLSVVGIVATRRRPGAQGMRRGIAGLVVALVVLMFPVVVAVDARGSAPIHDVTTDTVDPPGFVAVLPIRAQRRGAQSGRVRRPERRGASAAKLPGHQAAVDSTWRRRRPSAERWRQSER